MEIQFNGMGIDQAALDHFKEMEAECAKRPACKDCSYFRKERRHEDGNVVICNTSFMKFHDEENLKNS